MLKQKIERMVLMMAMLWAQEIMSAETMGRQRLCMRAALAC